MPNKTRLRKVMSTINILSKNAPDDAKWNQDSWNDGDMYIIGDDRQRFLLDETWDRKEHKYNYAVVVGDDGANVKCSTSGCFAGWAVALYAPVGTKVVDDQVFVPGREDFELIEYYAEELLGLDQSQADRLFAPSLELGELRELVREFTA